MGRIISFGGNSYFYDSLGQLITVKNSLGQTVESFTYDSAGNILSRTDESGSVSYTYGDDTWKDLLTAYDGQRIEYDEIGNPTSYRGWTFSWKNGRELEGASTAAENSEITFNYDAAGLRLSKTAGSVEHRYMLAKSALKHRCRRL